MLWSSLLCCASYALSAMPQDVPRGRADLRVWQRAGDSSARGPLAVFVRAHDRNAAATMASLGTPISPGTWALAHLDTGQLAVALAAGDGLQLRAAPPHRPLGGPPPALAHRAGRNLAPGAARDSGGTGVLIGLVDTGIDVDHPAFADANGVSRIVAVWDQDAVLSAGRAHPGPGHSVPAAFGYGHACDAHAIAAHTCIFPDAVGHGTHVASIAAGRSAQALGAAPGADIALVRSADFTQLADAVTYLFDLADTRGQPAVVNISVGGHYGPHDGRTPLEMFFNGLGGPGRSIVAAAGNDGDARLHVEVPLGPGPQRVGLRHLPVPGAPAASIEFWSTSDAVLEWHLELWRQGDVVAAVALTSQDSGIGHGVLAEVGSAMPVADVLYGGDWASEHGMLRHALIFSGDGVRPLQPHEAIALRLTGRGTLQGWVGQGHVVDTPVRFAASQRAGWISGDSARSIAVPATAVGVITVGSYSLGAPSVEPTGTLAQGYPTAGERSAFSSRGPTGFPEWTGLKPNLSAPGGPTVAARSRHVPDGPHTLDATRMVMQGTSMAAPRVTGAVARLLAADPTLRPCDVRHILAHTAVADRFTGAVPNTSWGAGKLDGHAALAALEAGPGGCRSGGPTSLWQVACILCGLHRAWAPRRQQQAPKART